MSAQGMPDRGMSTQGVCLPGGDVCVSVTGCLPGVVSPGGICQGGVCPGGGVFQHALDWDTHTSPWTE